MESYIGAREAMRIAGSYALGGVKVPHSVSNPVIRRLDDGKYAIALFVFTFNREQIKSGKANRPLEWLLLNPANGELIESVSCSNKDFSDDKSECVELRTSDNTKYSKEYAAITISIFDTMIKKYTEKNEFDKQFNDVYIYDDKNGFSRIKIFL